MEIHSSEEQANEAQVNETKTLIVKRLDLTFDNKQCQLITFSDITAYKNLEKEKKTTEMLKMVNWSVSHEMLGPLNTNVQLALLLLKTVLTEH